MPTTIESPKPVEVGEAPAADAEMERQAESVTALLIERQRNGYRRGLDSDGRKIGLAFDPGGLAGVVSAAMARKLELLGLLEYVDAFYGLSAGAFNALYAAPGQLKIGLDIYKDIAPDENLVEPAKLFPPQLPQMNLDILRKAFYDTRKIDVKKIVGERIPVVLGATDLSNPLKRPKIFRSTDLDIEHAGQLIEQALAGGHIMLVSGKPVELEDGHKYTDATMTWANTLDLAKADGCTDVLSLANFVKPTTNPDSRKAKMAEFITGSLGDKYLDSHSPELPPAYKGQPLKNWLLHPLKSSGIRLLDVLVGDTSDTWDVKTFKDTLERKEDAAKQFDGDNFLYEGVNVERLYPPDIEGLPELLTMDKKTLRVGIRAGRLAVRKALERIQQPV